MSADSIRDLVPPTHEEEIRAAFEEGFDRGVLWQCDTSLGFDTKDSEAWFREWYETQS